jgi:hypothetical protein
LLVGDGDFFSLALATAFLSGTNIVATSLVYSGRLLLLALETRKGARLCRYAPVHGMGEWGWGFFFWCL